MELANHRAREGGNPDNIHVATKADAGSIMRLLQTAVYSHLHVDWHLPGDWLGSSGFVVVPQAENRSNDNSLTAKLFQSRSNITACLAATAAPLPAAWVRVAAIKQANDAEEILARMLARVIPSLRKQGATQLAWLPVEDWPQPWLSSFGFQPGNEIETYVKEDQQLPDWPSVPGLTIRQVYSTDLEFLAELEAAAFAPIWRQSAHGLAVARPQSLSFDVALLTDEIVGYQLSANTESGAHLVRLTVHPEKQGLGIGSALLGHTLAGYHRRGLYTASLNTQVENISSQKLYLKFGFRASQQRLPIWVLDIS